MVKEIVDSGELGRVMFVQATEHMGTWLTADCYLRGWRSQRSVAGPLLLEKCCHDVDIVNWLLGVPCTTVSAIADRTVFVPRDDRPSRCRDCDDNTCVYRAAGVGEDRSVDDVGQDIYITDPNDRCVYNSDKDVADHFTLLARYEGGVHVSFNVTMGAPRGERRIRIAGSCGELSGCAEDNRIEVRPLGGAARVVEPAVTDTGGHYGGDRVLAKAFLDMTADREATTDATVEAGYRSGLICLAADHAARTGAVVDVRTLETNTTSA